MFGFGWDCQRCSYKQVYYAGFYPSQNNVQTHVPSRSSLMTHKKCVAASAHAEILPSVVWYVSPQSITARRVWGWKQKETLWPSYITVSHSGFLLSADLRVRSTEGEAEQPPWNHRKCPFISLIHIFVLANAAPSVILSLSLSLYRVPVEQRRPDLDGVLTNSNKNNPAWLCFQFAVGFWCCRLWWCWANIPLSPIRSFAAEVEF